MQHQHAPSAQSSLSPFSSHPMQLLCVTRPIVAVPCVIQRGSAAGAGALTITKLTQLLVNTELRSLKLDPLALPPTHLGLRCNERCFALRHGQGCGSPMCGGFTRQLPGQVLQL